MSRFLLRPEFCHDLDLNAQAVQARIANLVQTQGNRVELKCFPDYICLRIPEKDRHLWSPRLNLSLESLPNDRTRIEGIYGPNGNLWSLYLYGYLIIGSIGLFSSILGFCQWKLGNTPWGLWIFGVMAIAAATLYLLAQFGQKLAMYQTHLLHQTYESAMETPVEIQ